MTVPLNLGVIGLGRAFTLIFSFMLVSASASGESVAATSVIPKVEPSGIPSASLRVVPASSGEEPASGSGRGTWAAAAVTIGVTRWWTSSRRARMAAS